MQASPTPRTPKFNVDSERGPETGEQKKHHPQHWIWGCGGAGCASKDPIRKLRLIMQRGVPWTSKSKWLHRTSLCNHVCIRRLENGSLSCNSSYVVGPFLRINGSSWPFQMRAVWRHWRDWAGKLSRRGLTHCVGGAWRHQVAVAWQSGLLASVLGVPPEKLGRGFQSQEPIFLPRFWFLGVGKGATRSLKKAFPLGAPPGFLGGRQRGHALSKQNVSPWGASQFTRGWQGGRRSL